ncbi:MAG: serine/threonine protein kinase [Planctomycetota bacterium]|nr:MAG: serine/threonine protein kinase [Planctomycetota bacterium]
MLDQKRQVQMERLLRLRGSLLRPRREIIERAIRRCLTHDRNHDEDGDTPGDGLAGRGVTPTSTDVISGSDLGAVAMGKSPSQELKSAHISQAVVLPEDDPSTSGPEDLDITQRNSQGRLIPATIRKGSTSIKGLAPGSVIKGYRIEAIIGIGGMGQVYRATQMSMDRQVALKILNPRLAKNPSFRKRFLREARHAGHLQHPHLIAVHDVDESSDMIFFSMELVDGKSLKNIIRERGHLHEGEALAIVRQCLEGLRYAHDKGLIHRDIKPDNIMINSMGQVKIADLGLARLQEAEDRNATGSGSFMGTPHYMAPEQSRDAHTVDLRADLYGLGATLYHMICGSPPFTGNSAMDVLLRAATQDVVFPNPGPSEGMRRIIIRLLEKDPADRPQNARAALDLLASAGRGIDDAAPPPVPRRRRNHRQLVSWIVAGIFTVIMIAALAYLLSHGSQQYRWQQTIDRVHELVEAHQYHQAIGVLSAYQEQNSDAQFVEPAATLHQDIVQQWNRHSETTYAEVLRQLDDLVYRSRYDRAQQQLRRLRGDASIMSPYMQERIAEIEAVLERHQQRSND